VPYVGGGVGFLTYKETSDFAEPGDDVDDTFTTYNVLGGVDVRLSKWIGAGAEIGWRFVPNALEDSYLGQQFGEDDLGGLTIRALITVGK
jgi:opacity protein-like surface antigen